MITATISATQDSAATVHPVNRLRALRAVRTRLERAGHSDRVAKIETSIAALVEANPGIDVKATKPAGTGDPRRRLAALRAVRSRARNAGESTAEHDARIEAFIAEYPEAAAPKVAPKSELLDDEGQLDRSAVVAAYADHKALLVEQMDRILRRSNVSPTVRREVKRKLAKAA